MGAGQIRRSALRRSDSDLRLEQAGAFAGRTPARFRQAIFAEHETAVLASRRNDLDAMTYGLGRSQRVMQFLFHVTATQAHVPRNRRRRSRSVGEQVNELATKCHWEWSE